VIVVIRTRCVATQLVDTSVRVDLDTAVMERCAEVRELVPIKFIESVGYSKGVKTIE